VKENNKDQTNNLKPFYSRKTDEKVLKDAATVILLRENDAGPFEIFLMRRHRQQAFMGGAFVFPGGSLDDEDRHPDLAGFARGLTADEAALRLNEANLDRVTALGLYYAAVRETFEEAGVLLARTASGQRINFSDPDTGGRFQALRLSLHSQEISLLDLARREDLIFTLDLLTPYSHWITPEIESRRFDTRFLLARIPAGQVPIHDSIEMTESLWLTPAEALDRQRSGEITLMPPTLKTIEELTAFSSVDRLFEFAREREIAPIMPQAFNADGGFGVLLPHDPEYSIPDLKRPDNPDEPSRIVMKDGRWETVKVKKR